MEEKLTENMKAKAAFGKMLRINRLHKSAVDKKTGVHEIHRSQFMMMMFLAHEKECPSQKEIAAKFNVSPAAIAMSMKKMEKAGLIERKNALFDNRMNLVTLSDKGKEFVTKAGELFNKVDCEMFKGVTDEEFDALNRIFDKLIQNLLSVGAEDSPCLIRTRDLAGKNSDNN